MSRLGAAVALVLAVTSVTGCGGSSSGGQAGGASCSFTKESSPMGKVDPGLPPAAPDRTSGTVTAALSTSAGPLAFEMDYAKTPCTATSFRHLADKGFFNGTRCHRLTTQGIFVLQCGDPTATGTGGPGYTIPDEALTGATYPAGTVAMANTGQPHTGGSQFFLCYQDTPLPPSYTPFGRITTGLTYLRAVAAAGTASGEADGPPVKEVEIKTFRVS